MDMTRWVLPALILTAAACGGRSSSPAPTQPTTPNSPGSSTCVFAAEPIAPLDAVGGSLSVSVKTEAGCRWTVATVDAWITIERTGPFTGPESIALSVDPNRSFGGRSGRIVIQGDNGETLAASAVSQRAASCLYSVEPSTVILPWMGTYDGAGDSPITVRVHAEPPECRWTSTPSVPWIRVGRDDTAGTGDRTISVSTVDSNFGRTRIGDVVVAGLSGINPDARMLVTQGRQ